MKVVAGFDPGISGAWAVVRDDGALLGSDMLPVAGSGAQRMVSAPLLFDAIRAWDVDVAMLEAVSAMPKQGISSAFKFGRSVGVIEGVLGGLRWPVSYVTPAKWKRHFGLGPDKEACRQFAIRHWPDKASTLFARKMDHQRAEAALIALYYIETQRGVGA